ncbi:MAG TPA: hypothetical protein VKA61_11450 [Sphingomicrobium sp.]|nr:hypothetical protein [Sphingomicrobium sp.]
MSDPQTALNLMRAAQLRGAARYRFGGNTGGTPPRLHRGVKPLPATIRAAMRRSRESGE